MAALFLYICQNPKRRGLPKSKQSMNGIIVALQNWRTKITNIQMMFGKKLGIGFEE